MCLEPEFFDQREAAVARREARGDRELEAWLEARDLALDLLYDLGYLSFDPERGVTTADLFVHEVAVPARPFFRQDPGLQLIFVRAGQREELARRLADRVGPQAPVTRP
jgi:hypothetical protein